MFSCFNALFVQGIFYSWLLQADNGMQPGSADQPENRSVGLIGCRAGNSPQSVGTTIKIKLKLGAILLECVLVMTIDCIITYAKCIKWKIIGVLNLFVLYISH